MGRRHRRRHSATDRAWAGRRFSDRLKRNAAAALKKAARLA